MCYTSGENIALKLFMVDNTLSKSINPRNFSENMFYWNTLNL